MQCTLADTRGKAAILFNTVALLLAPVLGSEIKLNNGRTLNGEIVAEGDSHIVLDADGSRITIYKSLIAEIDGKSYGPASPAEPATPLEPSDVTPITTPASASQTGTFANPPTRTLDPAAVESHTPTEGISRAPARDTARSAR